MESASGWIDVLRGTEDEEERAGTRIDHGNMVRTLFRLLPSFQLIPSWEGQSADPEEKRGPAKGITPRMRKLESA